MQSPISALDDLGIGSPHTPLRRVRRSSRAEADARLDREAFWQVPPGQVRMVVVGLPARTVEVEAAGQPSLCFKWREVKPCIWPEEVFYAFERIWHKEGVAPRIERYSAARHGPLSWWSYKWPRIVDVERLSIILSSLNTVIRDAETPLHAKPNLRILEGLLEARFRELTG